MRVNLLLIVFIILKTNHYALNFVLEMEFFDIPAESDCLQLVMEIKHLRDLCSYSNRIFLECTYFSNKFKSFALLHVRQKGKFSAHTLAKFVLVNLLMFG